MEDLCNYFRAVSNAPTSIAAEFNIINGGTILKSHYSHNFEIVSSSP